MQRMKRMKWYSRTLNVMKREWMKQGSMNSINFTSMKLNWRKQRAMKAMKSNHFNSHRMVKWNWLIYMPSVGNEVMKSIHFLHFRNEMKQWMIESRSVNGLAAVSLHSIFIQFHLNWIEFDWIEVAAIIL